MFIEQKGRDLKCEPIENGRFRITSTMVDEMDAEMYLSQIKNIQGALDQEQQHQITLPEKLKNDMQQIADNILNQTKFLNAFKVNEEQAKGLLPSKPADEVAAKVPGQ